MPDAIRVEGLSRTFIRRRSLRDTLTHPWVKAERVLALEDVSFRVERGEIFGLLGPNGAGKTTLLKILSCLILQNRGRVSVNGYDTLQHETLVKASIGFVTSDERSFYWRLSGRENLHFFARLYNLPPDRVKKRCQTLLDQLDLTGKADHAFMNYSSGMKQRMAVARALLHDPPILYMDEPTRSLDPLAAKHVRELIMETLNGRQGKTILLATHNLSEAEQMCSRIAILHKARVRKLGTLDEIRAGTPGRERYDLEVSGVAAEGIPRQVEGTVVHVERATQRTILLRADVEPGGPALTRLLSELVGRGATIVSCDRTGASLQEIFDLTVEQGESA
ncbi:MAG: ABC transporter ATP-binding protein [Acidobacteriota bacterium]